MARYDPRLGPPPLILSANPTQGCAATAPESPRVSQLGVVTEKLGVVRKFSVIRTSSSTF